MSKFKVGDKVRYIGGDKPDDPMNIGYTKSMLRNGEVGIITEIKTLSKDVVIIVQHDKRGGTHQYIYDPNWLELVEDKPKRSLLHHNFNIGDIVEFIGSRTDYSTAPEGPVEISDFTDKYIYIQGDMQDSGKGWLPEQFKLVDTIPTKPKQKFKVGDKVRCIDDSGQRTVYAGCVYLVHDISVDGHLLLKECGGSYMHSRFELVADKPEKPERKFKPDDFVICVDASGPVVSGVIKEGKVYKVKNVSNKGSFIALHGITGSFKAERFAPLNSTAPTIGGNSPDKVWFDEATTLTLGEQDMSIDTTVAVLNKTYIFGKDADTVTVDDVFNHITRLEAEAAMYDSIKNKPKAIKAKVNALKADIESLVKFSDEKFSD